MLPNLGIVKHYIPQLLSVITPMNTFFALVPIISPFAPRSVPLSPPALLCVLGVEHSNLGFSDSLVEATVEDKMTLPPFKREHVTGSLGSWEQPAVVPSGSASALESRPLALQAAPSQWLSVVGTEDPSVENLCDGANCWTGWVFLRALQQSETLSTQRFDLPPLLSQVLAVGLKAFSATPSLYLS